MAAPSRGGGATLDQAELCFRRGVTRERDRPQYGSNFLPPMRVKSSPCCLEALRRKRPTRLEVIMVRANQSERIGKSKALFAGATPTYETDGDIGSTLRDRDNDRAEDRTDERMSKRLRGVGKLALVPIGALRTQENDAERAVRAALAIQRALVEINARNVSKGAPQLSARRCHTNLN